LFQECFAVPGGAILLRTTTGCKLYAELPYLESADIAVVHTEYFRVRDLPVISILL